MSYEIVYAKKFIKLSNGVILPMILSGSNNCTMFTGIKGREILERHWNPFFGFMDKTGDELIAWAEDRVKNSHPSGEWFKEGSKWVTNETFPRWFKNCVQKASSIEDILSANPYVSFYAALSLYDSSKGYCEDGYHSTEMREYLQTTEEIEKWIEKAKKRKEEWNKGEAYFNLEFSTIKPLKANSAPKNISGPVICSPQRGYYITKYTENGYSYCKNISQALVFENEEAFKASSLTKRIRGYKLLSANITKKEKNFVITVIGGSYSGKYVKRLSAHSLSFTSYFDEARKFEREKEALTYIEEKLKGRFSGAKEFEVKNLKEKEKDAV